MRIPIRQLDPELPIPSAANPGDAGYDLRSTIDCVLPPGGGRAIVPTGIAIAIPDGYAGLILPRSGLAAKHGISCVNAPGLIDSGYRDEIKVILINTDPSDPFQVERGDRIAQLMIQEVHVIEWEFVDTLSPSERGLGGLGSSGR